jgi:hypothetical protein
MTLPYTGRLPTSIPKFTKHRGTESAQRAQPASAQGHCQHDDEAREDLLLRCGEPKQDRAIVDEPNEQRSGDRPFHASAASAKRSSAYHHRGENGEQIAATEIIPP